MATPEQLPSGTSGLGSRGVTAGLFARDRRAAYARGVPTTETNWLGYLPGDVRGIVAPLLMMDPSLSGEQLRSVMARQELVPLKYQMSSRPVRQERARMLYRANFASNDWFAVNYCDYRGDIDWEWAYQAATCIMSQTKPFLATVRTLAEEGSYSSDTAIDFDYAYYYHFDVCFRKLVAIVLAVDPGEFLDMLDQGGNHDVTLMDTTVKMLSLSTDPQAAALCVRIEHVLRQSDLADVFSDNDGVALNYPALLYAVSLGLEREQLDDDETPLTAALLTDDIEMLRHEVDLRMADAPSPTDVEEAMFAFIMKNFDYLPAYDLINIFNYCLAHMPGDDVGNKLLIVMASKVRLLFMPKFLHEEYRIMDLLINKYHRILFARDPSAMITFALPYSRFVAAIDSSKYSGPLDFIGWHSEHPTLQAILVYHQWSGNRTHDIASSSSLGTMGESAAGAKYIELVLRSAVTTPILPDQPTFDHDTARIGNNFTYLQALFNQYIYIRTLVPWERTTDVRFRPVLNCLLNSVLSSIPMELSIRSLYLLYVLYYYQLNQRAVVPFRVYYQRMSTLERRGDSIETAHSYLPESITNKMLDETIHNVESYYVISPVGHTRLITFNKRHDTVATSSRPELAKFVDLPNANIDFPPMGRNLIYIRPGVWLLPRNKDTEIVYRGSIYFVDYDIDDVAWLELMCKLYMV